MRKGWTEGSRQSYIKSMKATCARKKAAGIHSNGRPRTIFVLSTHGQELFKGNEDQIRAYLGLSPHHSDTLWKYAREGKQIQGYDITKEEI